MKLKNYVYDKHRNYKFLIENGVLLKTYLTSDYDNVREINIPDSVTELSKTAFSNCEVWNVKRIFIPKTVTTVQNGAFYEFVGEFVVENSCTSVKYQDDILYSGDMTRIIKATGNLKGKPVIIPHGVTEIGAKAFYKMELQFVQLPTTLTYIGKEAFAENELVEISLPENLFKIDRAAFEFNHIKAVNIPKSLTAINVGAFDYNDIIEFQVDNENKHFKVYNGVLFNSNLKKLIQCPQKKVGTFTIPNNTTQIVKTAFSCCELDEVVIPATIGETLPCFFEFSRIKKVVIEDGIECIESNAFLNCNFLEEVILPSSIKRIESQAFNGCVRLKHFTIPDGTEYIGDWVITGKNIEEIHIPSSVTYIGMEAFPVRKSYHKEDVALKYLLIHNNPYAVQYAKDNGYPYKEI